MAQSEDSSVATARTAGLNRREFLATVAAAQGAFVLGFWVPQKAEAQTPSGAAWYEEPATRFASRRPSSARASGRRTR